MSMPSPGRPRPQYPIDSVDNALRLILMLRDEPSLRVTDAAESLGVAVSTAYRLLAMLQYHGFVDQDLSTKAYVAGPTLLEVGLVAAGRLDLPALARPAMERLVEEVQETAHLFALEGTMVRFLESVESPKTVRVSSRVGHTMAAHSTSGGKAILSTLPEPALAALYPEERIEPINERSITSRAELISELEAVRDRGYATNLGESEDEVSAIGMALVDSTGTTRGAISVSAPSQRLIEEQMPAMVGALRRAVDDVVGLLG